MGPGYVARRLLQMVPVAAGVVVITFLIVYALGDPTQLDAEGVDAAQQALVRRELGLDRPVLNRFASYAGRLLHGDLGRSYQGPPVASLIAQRVWATLLLAGTALIVSSAAGIALGLVAARRPFRWLDVVINSGALVSYAVPGFWLGQLVVLVLILPTGLFPVEGMTGVLAPDHGWGHVADVARHLTVPAAVLAASEIALVTRLTRTGVLNQLSRDYVRTARSKGVPEPRIRSHHALPNALLPVVTVIGSRVGFLLSGAVLVESVFAWPGLGTLLIDSARSRDQPTVLALVLLTAVTVMLANLATDLVCARLDPRFGDTVRERW